MLNEPVAEPLAPGAAGGGQAGGQLPGMGAMPMPDEASYIHVTQEEKQAIDRVSAIIVLVFCYWLWSPYRIGQTIIFSSFRLFFFLLLVSLKNRTQKSRHLGTIAQLCWSISSQRRHVSTIGKKLVKQQYVLHMSPQCGELWTTSGWDRSGSLRHPCKFQRVSHLGSVTARHLVVGVSHTLRRWAEGATYVRQGDHHIGHWPTFLVDYCD